MFSVLIVPYLSAQNTGSIFGRVTDSSGHPIPGAEITVNSVGESLTRNAQANDSGEYTLPALPVGTYRVTVTAPSFATIENTNVTVDAEHNVRLDSVLKASSVTQQITVVADAPPQVDTSSSVLGTLINNQLIQDLPNSGRNIINLVELLPGVSNISAPTTFAGDRSGPTFNVSGGRGNSNLLLLDGLLYNDLFRNTGQNYPAPDALEEVEVLTGSFKAEYGHNVGSIMNVVTKSGTNQFHGAFWEYMKNTAFDASNYMTGVTNADHQNQFGATVGGPILKDKLFFFLEYQGLIQASTASSATTGLTSAERAGDFSADAIAANKPVNGYLSNPNSTKNKNYAALHPLLSTACASALGTGQYIAGSVIPTACLSTVAQNLDNKYLPLANGTNGVVNINYPEPINNDSGLARVDWHFGSHMIDGRYYVENTSQNTTNGSVPTYEALANAARNQVISVNDVYAISGSLLNTIRVGYHRFTVNVIPTDRTTLASLGSNFPVFGLPDLPSINVSSRFTLSSNSADDQHDVNQDLDLLDAVNWTHGNHNLQFGAEYLRLQYLNRTYFLTMGQFTYSGIFTANAAADYALGFSSALAVDSPHQEQSGIQHNMFGYIQDDWRIRPRLVLNLGVRYELPMPWYQPQNYWATLIPGQQSKKIPNAPAGLVFPGDPGVSRGLVSTPLHDLAPRIGFAYDLFGNGKTSIRGGFGLFFDAVDANIIQNNTQPFVYGFTFTGAQSLSNPLLGQPVIPTAVNYTNPTFVGTQQIYYPDRNLTTPYVESFNLGIQQQLMKNLAIEVNYVGKLGRKQPLPYASNPAIYSATATSANTDSRRILQGYGNNTDYATIGTSNYNSLQVQVVKRLSSYVSAQGAYTYAASFDTFSGNTETPGAPNVFNLSSEYAPSSFNPRHVGSLGYTVYAPKFEHSGFMVRNFLGGWNLSGIYSVRAGLPLNITTGADNALSGTQNQRPSLLHSFNLSSDRGRTAKMAEWFDTTAFAVPAAGTFGNLERDAVLGPGHITNNASLARSFPLPFREGMILKFRCEAIGIFNTPNLGNPGTTLGKSLGVITSASGNRTLQLSLHLNY